MRFGEDYYRIGVISAVLLCLLPVLISLVPPESTFGSAVRAAIFAVPGILSLVTIRRIVGADVGVLSVSLGVLSAVTLLFVVWSTYAIYHTPGTFTYEGRGVFLGPLVVLGSGLALAVTVIVERFVRGTAGSSSAT